MIDQETFQRYALDPAAFRNDLIVDVDGLATPFGKVMDDWQRTDFAALDPALKRAAGRSRSTRCRMRAYLERPRGHSKTTDLAVTSVWALAFASRPVRCYAYAADRDQAALLKDAMATILRLNPWLNFLKVQGNRVINTAQGHPAKGAQLEIASSDVGSSYGILADVIVADELVHWEGEGGLWESLISSAAKRKHCLMVVISNAGFCDSWQWNVREAARTDNSWIFSRLDGPVASWLSADRLAEQERMLPGIAYSRLWLNQWSSGAGDAIAPSDIAAAFANDLQPTTTRCPDWLYASGIDLGLTRDCSAVITLAVPAGGRSGRIRLAAHKLWKPTPGHKVNLMDVERYVLDLDQRFGLETVAADPWQAEHLIQRIEVNSAHRRRNARRVYALQPWVRVIPPTGSNLRDQASIVIECFTDYRLQFYDCPPLRRDLDHLRAEEKSYGFRLTSPRDKTGHGDSFSAFALALLVAHDLAGKKPVRARITPFDSPSDQLTPRQTMEANYHAMQSLHDLNAEIRASN